MKAMKHTRRKGRVVVAAAAALVALGTLGLGQATLAQDRRAAGGAVAAGPAVVAAEAAVAPAPAPVPGPIRIDHARELMITDLSVVEDPVRTTGLGAWTFGRLMANMAGCTDPSAFVLNWLASWELDRTVNGFLVPGRPSIRGQITEPWLRASGGTGRLDLSKAPFRLLAIVNRIDLRKNQFYGGGGGNAGEGRFVVGALDANGHALPFTAIFEYELPARTTGEVKMWADRWHRLGSIPFGPAYNQALEVVTEAYSGARKSTTKPNGSLLNQLRTNEIALASPWELREFNISARSGHLFLTTVKQSPDLSFNGTPELAQFINANEQAVIAGTHKVPDAWLGGADPARFIINAPGIQSPLARHKFALNTCAGCHFRETGTGFTHVGVRSLGQQAPLSGFLTGTTIPDPISGDPRTFADLGRRALDLKHVLEASRIDLAVEPATTTAVH